MATIAEDIVKFWDDPYKFVIYAFPWGEPGTPLEKYDGPDKWQKELLNLVRDEIRAGNPQAIQMAVTSGHGVGKAQPSDTIIETPKGHKRFGDLVVGDEIFGSDGKSQKVIAIHEQGVKDVYRVTFNDRRSTLCCADHLWQVTTQVDRKKHRGHRVVDTKEISENLHLSYHVPMCKPVEYECNEETILNPYFIGYLLGNGSFTTNTIHVYSAEIGHHDYIETLLPEGCSFRGKKMKYKHISSGPNARPGSNKVLNGLRSLGLMGSSCDNRFVPNVYKYNKSSVRLEVLRGLMDSDGTIAPRTSDGRKGYYVTFSTTSKSIRDDIIWIVRSLGGRANYSKLGPITTKLKDGRIIKGKLDVYGIKINLPNNINPFRLKRKKDMYNDYVATVKREPHNRIKRIEFVGKADCRCVTVENKDGLYLANDFIVTHNSSLTSWIILWYISTRPNPQILVTANTLAQLNTKTWRELSKWHQLAINHDWFEWTATKFYLKEKPETWFAAALPWSEHRSEAFAGMHEENVLVIFDEASGIADKIWEVVEGAMTTEGAMWFAFGNPTQNIGRFRECFRKFKHRWKQFRIDSRTAKMANQAQIEQWKEDYGEDSDFFLVRVKGEFPSRAAMQFIPSHLVEEAIERNAADQKDFPYIVGVDVARSDGDNSVICVRQGRRLLVLNKYTGLNGVQLTHKIAEIASSFPGCTIFIDEIGVGASVVDHCKLLNIRFIGVNSGAAPDNPMLKNHRAQMWYNMREWLSEGGDIPNDPDLIKDLIGLQYDFEASTDKLILESKKDIRSRQGSPDCGDALALTFSQKVLPPKLMVQKRAPIQQQQKWDPWHV